MVKIIFQYTHAVGNMLIFEPNIGKYIGNSFFSLIKFTEFTFVSDLERLLYWFKVSFWSKTVYFLFHEWLHSFSGCAHFAEVLLNARFCGVCAR